ncbi:MAG: dirigent protein [Aestuariivirgaceae bacterium]|nr:dirigent protein [Aestuariivirgaceae bacterium]
MKMEFAAIAALLMLVTSAAADANLTVSHGETPNPTHIDLGTPGDSVGDQRIWNFPGSTGAGEPVVMNWMMTTTVLAGAGIELEGRASTGIFTIGPDAKDSLIIQGMGFYPPTGSTLKASAKLERAIIGGTGKYSGARGSAVSTHFDDGTWQHEFTMQ